MPPFFASIKPNRKQQCVFPPPNPSETPRLVSSHTDTMWRRRFPEAQIRIVDSSMSESPSSSSILAVNADLRSDDCDRFFWYDSFLVVLSVLFVLYLSLQARKNLKRLANGGSYVVISYYALLWFVTLLNLAWSFFQAWQCSPGKEVAWNFLSLFTTAGMLCLEISLMAFLLKDNCMNSMETLARTFLVSGIVVLVDALLKTIYVFGFSVPLFNRNVGSTHTVKWSLWIIHKLLLAMAYGFILFVHFSKRREKLPPRPAFHNYVVVMFVFSAIALFSCGLAGLGMSLGNWLYDLTVLCYHSLYLPFLYATFLADFFQEEDFLLDNAYYSEMKDAGFFDADLE